MLRTKVFEDPSIDRPSQRGIGPAAEQLEAFLNTRYIRHEDIVSISISNNNYRKVILLVWNEH